METFQKIICPNMVIDTKTTDKCHVSQSVISNLRHRNPLRGFSWFLTIFLAHSSDLSFVFAPEPTLTVLAVTASNNEAQIT